MSELTAKEVIELTFGDDGDEVELRCASCKDRITSWDLVTPCHPHTGFAEGSGHGGIDGMFIFCAQEVYEEESYCGWGGPVKEYLPQLICKMCGKSPFKEGK